MQVVWQGVTAGKQPLMPPQQSTNCRSTLQSCQLLTCTGFSTADSPSFPPHTPVLTAFLGQKYLKLTKHFCSECHGALEDAKMPSPCFSYTLSIKHRNRSLPSKPRVPIVRHRHHFCFQQLLKQVPIHVQLVGKGLTVACYTSAATSYTGYQFTPSNRKS